MKVAEFDFELPPELIAQEPPAERGDSRLLVLDRSTGTIAHRRFAALPEYLRGGDLLVLNNTRVFPARLLGRRVPSGGAVECLLLHPVPAETSLPARGTTADESRDRTAGDSPRSTVEEWAALMHPGQKLKPGTRVVFEGHGVRLEGEVLAQHFHGRRTVRLRASGTGVGDAIERIGHMPLPPYIARADDAADRDRYQTIFARHRGSIAAPTAGLHFTAALLDQLREGGVEVAEVTLHVGYGTFKPVRVDDVEAHEVDPETYEVTADAAGALTRARREGRRIIAVGTTTTRVLESLPIDDERVVPARGDTRTFIYPGHRFQLVDALVTNFHLPRSSLLMLVAALGGRDRVLAAYREAIRERYRFYSYGDAMLVL